MSKTHYKFTHALFAGTALILSGCSSDDGGGPAVPASAVSISASNAAMIVQLATLTTSSLTTAGAVAEAAAPGTGFCSGGGTATLDGTGTQTSFSGMLVMSSCVVDAGATHVLNGSLSVSSSFTSSGDYTDSASGSVSLNAFGTPVTVSGISYAETGNEFTGSYSINASQFTYDPSGGGFAAQVVSPIVGNTANACPSGGSILIYGANGTQARAHFDQDGPDTVTVEYNDGTGFQTDAVYSCSSFFI